MSSTQPMHLHRVPRCSQPGSVLMAGLVFLFALFITPLGYWTVWMVHPSNAWAYDEPRAVDIIFRIGVICWFAFLSLFLPLMLARASYRKLRWRWVACPDPHCPECDYNLRGNHTGVCPECGTDVSPRLCEPTGA